jgi:hypothetical protein
MHWFWRIEWHNEIVNFLLGPRTFLPWIYVSLEMYSLQYFVVNFSTCVNSSGAFAYASVINV